MDNQGWQEEQELERQQVEAVNVSPAMLAKYPKLGDPEYIASLQSKARQAIGWTIKVRVSTSNADKAYVRGRVQAIRLVRFRDRGRSAVPVYEVRTEYHTFHLSTITRQD